MEILNLINFFFDFVKALFNNAIKNCLESNTELCRQIKISNIKMCRHKKKDQKKFIQIH